MQNPLHYEYTLEFQNNRGLAVRSAQDIIDWKKGDRHEETQIEKK